MWHRRFGDQRGYSICGITHTVASKEAMASIGELLIAPLQPWDALICTSQAVEHVVSKRLADWRNYLERRLGADCPVEPRLPVIPLGIDCEGFPTGTDAHTARSRIRQELGIPSEDVVVLFVGRLVFYGKAHPVPMYLALERAAQATGRRLQFIQAGWFEEDKDRRWFEEAARAFCPSVTCHFLDGRVADVRRGVWSAAEIFLSLSDNVQETFGLTPIEAMANGLPVIVSDWNGYQESVRNRQDGFAIPTRIPSMHSGGELARSYLADWINYGGFLAHTSMATAVDVDACAVALERLILDPELRARMGDSGRERAREVYDWRRVIPAYERLWDELAELRATAPESEPRAGGGSPYPLLADPFDAFAHYASDRLTDATRIRINPSAPELDRLMTSQMVSWGSTMRLPPTELRAVLSRIASAGEVTLGDLLGAGVEGDLASRARLERTVLYLTKFNVLLLDP